MTEEREPLLQKQSTNPTLEDEVEKLIGELRIDEKVDILSGCNMWESGGVPRLGLAPLRVTDGPHGARGPCLYGVPGAILSPCECALAATFSESTVYEVGKLLGEDCARKGCHVLLGPTLNLQRYPNSGRHFECFSEDPFLTAKLAVEWINGVQCYVAACAKHFVGNDQETDRGTMNSVIDERTLREVYLRPFEAAAIEAKVQSFMCGYNRLNGIYCTENSWLLDDVLRGEWSFSGFVMSDWWGNRSTSAALQAGLNMEMPGLEPRFYGGHLVEAVQKGIIKKSLLDDRCRPMLRALLQRDRLATVPAPDPERRRSILLRAAQESLVMVRNESGVLPLKPSQLRRVAVLGPNAAGTVLQGGGSSRVQTRRCATILEQIRSLLEPKGIVVRHESGCTWEQLPSHMITVDVEGLLSMGGCEMDGQPTSRWSWVFRQTHINDSFLSFAAAVSRKEWFRKGFMPCLRRCGFRLSSPEEAAAAAAKQLGKEHVSNNACHTWLPLGAAAIAIVGFLWRFGAMRFWSCITTVAMGCIACAGLRLRGGGPDGRKRSAEDAMILAAEQEASQADACILVLGTHGWWEIEGVDQPHMCLLGRQDELVTRVALAAKGRPVIAILNVGSPKLIPWVEQIPGIIVAHFGGEELATAVVDTLFGVSCPSGRLPTTWPINLDDVPAVAAAKAKHDGSCKAHPVGSVEYCEGVFVGYRGYESSAPWVTTGIRPLFPFGHGLSYACFSYAPPELKQLKTLISASSTSDPTRCRDPLVSVCVSVENVGSHAGAEVLQLYITSNGNPRALCGFKRTAKLAPNEKEVVAFGIGLRDLGMRYETSKMTWLLPRAGDKVKLEIGASSADIRQRAELSLV